MRFQSTEVTAKVWPVKVLTWTGFLPWATAHTLQVWSSEQVTMRLTCWALATVEAFVMVDQISERVSKASVKSIVLHNEPNLSLKGPSDGS